MVDTITISSTAFGILVGLGVGFAGATAILVTAIERLRKRGQ